MVYSARMWSFWERFDHHRLHLPALCCSYSARSEIWPTLYHDLQSPPAHGETSQPTLANPSVNGEAGPDPCGRRNNHPRTLHCGRYAWLMASCSTGDICGTPRNDAASNATTTT